jgi:hypothetical protein
LLWGDALAADDFNVPDWAVWPAVCGYRPSRRPILFIVHVFGGRFGVCQRYCRAEKVFVVALRNIAERMISICQSGNDCALDFINASPSENTKTATTMARTA